MGDATYESDSTRGQKVGEESWIRKKSCALMTPEVTAQCDVLISTIQGRREIVEEPGN